jgi:hypothetical protein
VCIHVLSLIRWIGVARIFDFFFAEGIAALFAVGVALLQRAEKALIGQPFENILEFFHQQLRLQYSSNDGEIDQLIARAYVLMRDGKVSKKKLDKLEKDREAALSKSSDSSDIARILEDNKALRERIRYLERENLRLRLMGDQAALSVAAEVNTSRVVCVRVNRGLLASDKRFVCVCIYRRFLSGSSRCRRLG